MGWGMFISVVSLALTLVRKNLTKNKQQWDGNQRKVHPVIILYIIYIFVDQFLSCYQEYHILIQI